MIDRRAAAARLAPLAPALLLRLKAGRPLDGAHVVLGVVRLAHVHHGVRRVIRGEHVGVGRAATPLAAATAAGGAALGVPIVAGVAAIAVGAGVGVIRAAANTVDAVVGRGGIARAPGPAGPTGAAVTATAAAAAARALVGLVGAVRLAANLGLVPATGVGVGDGLGRLRHRTRDVRAVGAVNAEKVVVGRGVAGASPPAAAAGPAGRPRVGVRAGLAVGGLSRRAAALLLAAEALLVRVRVDRVVRPLPSASGSALSSATGAADAGAGAAAGGWKSTCGGWKTAAGTAGATGALLDAGAVAAAGTAAWPDDSLLSVSRLLGSLSSIRAISSQASGRARTQGVGAPHGGF